MLLVVEILADNAVCDDKLAENEVATELLKLPVALAILALLALNEVATDSLYVLYPNVPLNAVWIEDVNTLSPVAKRTFDSLPALPAFQ